MPNPPSEYETTESPLLAQIRAQGVSLPVLPDSFLRLFVKLNKLDQISHFLFQPGMLFNDTLQWWRSKKRSHPHEGIDIYLMQSFDMDTCTVLPQMMIPAMLSGYMVHFHRDFLGETLYIRHPEIRQKNTTLHTLYGHICAIPGSRGTAESLPYAHICSTGSALGVQTSVGLTCSSFINKGQIVGTISPPPATSSVPAHLHISCAWIDEELQVEELNWGNMSTSGKVIFIDPLPFLLK